MAKTNLEHTLETLVEFSAIHRSAMAQTNENINALTAQIGVLSESITRLEIKVDRIADTAQQQNETAKIQAENVAALIEVVRSTAGIGGRK